ncbi:MAG: citrate synthase, partial [Faecalibacterium sp.]
MHDFTSITPELEVLTELCKKNSSIDPADYVRYEVNRGLRDLKGNGVLTGLTEISEIHSRELVDGVMTPCAGSLFYRGYNVEELCASFTKEGHFGFEETT